MKKSLVVLLLTELIYPGFVIFLFRSQILPQPALIAGFGFTVLCGSTLYFTYNSPLRLKSAGLWGAVVFGLGSIVPIMCMQYMHYFSNGEAFMQQSFLGISAGSYHEFSSRLYGVMAFGLFTDLIRIKLITKK